MSIMQTVLQTEHFKVIDHVCRHPRVDCGYVQGVEPARIILTRHGSFAMHVAGRTRLARPGQAVMIGKHAEYRVSHPDEDGCDCCTDIWLSDPALAMLRDAGAGEQAFSAIDHDLQFQCAHVEMLQGMKQHGEVQDADDLLFDALSWLVALPRASLRQESLRVQVQRAEETIVGHADENIDIATLAHRAGCSPFHLCRLFRAATGQSLRRFRLQQRLGSAVGRLGDGEQDLAGLAFDLGFSSHSHMTDAFRRALGMTPGELRRDLRQSDLRQLRSRMQAWPRCAA